VPIPVAVTISLGRLLLVVAGLVMILVFVVGVLVWQLRRGGGEAVDGAAFRQQASAICREHLPKLRLATDIETALPINQAMRARLAALTPPPAQQSTFDAWLLALEGAENAAIQGNRDAVTAFDGRARGYATTLGVGEACILDV
jgi:hypothetical protein